MNGSVEDRLRRLGTKVVAEAIEALRREHITADARFGSGILFHRNRFEDTIRATDNYVPLEHTLIEAFPHRFADSLPGSIRDRPTKYITSFVEAAIWGDAGGSEPATDGKALSQYVDEVDELIAVLATPNTELSSCRVVSHITTTTGCPVQIGDVVVHPSESDPDRHYWGALPIIERYIPEASRVLSDDQSLVGLAPGSVVEVRTRVARPGLEFTKISERIDDFLLAVRLITGATVESHVEVRGRTSRIGWIRPDTTQFW